MFLRLVDEAAKGEELLREVRSLRGSTPGTRTFPVPASALGSIPGSPFAYWASTRVLALFGEFPPFQNDRRKVRLGLSTKNDKRFVRLRWEVPPSAVGPVWSPYANGSECAPFYWEHSTVVASKHRFAELSAYLMAKFPYLANGANWVLHLENDYNLPAVGWPLRALTFSPQPLTAGFVFSARTYAAYVPHEHLYSALGFLSSRTVDYLLKLSLAETGRPEYVTGVVRTLPTPAFESCIALKEFACQAVEAKRRIERHNETCAHFVLPSLVRPSPRQQDLASALERTALEVSDARTLLSHTADQIDAAVRELYRINEADRANGPGSGGERVMGLPEPVTGQQAAAALVSWMVGVVVGRFDVRLATGGRTIPELPDPFTALPPSSPGMLPEGSTPPAYPIPVDDDGVLVDDEPHADDVVRRVREVFRFLWEDQADEVEKATCALLRTKALRDYFAKTGKGGFWDDHFRRYSKSRRRAPIYWPVQSPRGLYRIWIYAHRLTRDTLPKLLGQRYLGGALAGVKHTIDELRLARQTKADLTKKQEERLAGLEELLVDLEEFMALLRAAVARTNDQGDTVGYAPDLNDGVILAAAPLHQMIPWLKTRKHGGKTVTELQAYWEELESGEYDWAHVAMAYWPTRVTEKSRKDKSLALAHGLDADFFPGLRDDLRRQAEASLGVEDAATEDDPADDEPDEE